MASHIKELLRYSAEELETALKLHRQIGSQLAIRQELWINTREIIRQFIELEQEISNFVDDESLDVNEMDPLSGFPGMDVLRSIAVDDEEPVEKPESRQRTNKPDKTNKTHEETESPGFKRMTSENHDELGCFEQNLIPQGAEAAKAKNRRLMTKDDDAAAVKASVTPDAMEELDMPSPDEEDFSL